MSRKAGERVAERPDLVEIRGIEPVRRRRVGQQPRRRVDVTVEQMAEEVVVLLEQRIELHALEIYRAVGQRLLRRRAP